MLSKRAAYIWALVQILRGCAALYLAQCAQEFFWRDGLRAGAPAEGRQGVLLALGSGRDDVSAGRHGHLLRAFLGAGLFLTLEDLVASFTTHWMAVVGVVFMAFELFFPAGDWGSNLKRTERMVRG